MSPFLRFLAAARSLANQGMSKEAIEQFAKNEFGKINTMMQKQINNIFKPSKPVGKKDEVFDSTVEKMQFDNQGKPFNPRNPTKDYSKKAEGGRIGLKAGMSKRAFLKLMGGAGAGLAALKTGALKLLGKEAAPVATEVVKSAGSTAPPPYFFKLMEKIKFMGEKRKTPSYKERVNEYTYTGKDGSDYELIEDLDTGNIKITKDKLGGANYGDDISYETIEDRTEMVFRKGQADETTKGKKPPDEYEEYKVEFDQDGTAADAADIDEISKMEIVEEAGDPDSLTLKKAGGGIARMLGE